MAWTTPRTWSGVPTAAHLEEIRGNLVFLDENGYRGARVRNTTGQSLTHATEATITFDTEDRDSDGLHSLASNTSRITVPAALAGKVLLIASLAVDGLAALGSVSGQVRCHIRKNGTTDIGVATASPWYNPPSGSTMVVVALALAVDAAAASDYYEMRATQWSETTKLTSTSTWFELNFIGA